MNEKRQYERIDTAYTALYCSYCGVRAAKIKDLSKSGAALVFKDEIDAATGDNATIHFYSRDTGTLVAKANCHIVRVFSDDGKMGIGIHFDQENKGVDVVMDFLETQQDNTLS
ncbi:MAG: PilZ domain-containing protein [Lachnospiraceae bacterium]|nr:PilZ domain-containing protein [Lachnospiraceae bacterium]MBR1524912.1 PilZ domain-containing protein [Lachnospiraceae bacterium]